MRASLCVCKRILIFGGDSLTIARNTYYGREDNGGHIRPRPNSLSEPEEWTRIQLALQKEKISQSSIEEIKTIVLRVETRRDSTLPTPPSTPAPPVTVGVESSPADNRSSLSVSEYSVASNKSKKSGNNWLSKCSPKAIFSSMEQRFIDAARSGSTASLEGWAPEISEKTIHKAMIAVCRTQTPAEGHAETVSLLFRFGASFEYRDTKYYRTPLIWAVAEGRDDLVQLFLESKAPVEEPDYVQNWTPLLWAIWLGRNTAVDWLIESGADIKVADGAESNTLVMAARIGNYQAAKSILREDPGLVNSNNTDGMTPLAYAVEAADEEFAILLLENHAAAQCTNSKGVPVLTTAVKHESVAIAEMLLNNAATVDARDDQGCTALHWAVWKKNVALVQMLLARQADRTATDHQGWTVRKWAENSGSVDILQLIEDG